MSDGLWQMARPDLEERVAELEEENKQVKQILRNARNGLELLLQSHKPHDPSDPFDTVKAATDALNPFPDVKTEES